MNFESFCAFDVLFKDFINDLAAFLEFVFHLHLKEQFTGELTTASAIEQPRLQCLSGLHILLTILDVMFNTLRLTAGTER